MKNLFDLAAAPILALLVLLVLVASADAGIFRKRRCNSGGCSAPAAATCNTGSCGSPAGFSGSYVSPAAGVTYYTNGRPAQNCPNGQCPIQR